MKIEELCILVEKMIIVLKINCQLFHHLELKDKEKFVKELMKEEKNITKIPFLSNISQLMNTDLAGEKMRI